MTAAEAVEHMQGVWRSQDDENRLPVVEDTVVGLLDNATECHGEHDEGPIPITLTVQCEGEESPRVANAAGGGEILILGWEDNGDVTEMYSWVGDRDELLD